MNAQIHAILGSPVLLWCEHLLLTFLVAKAIYKKYTTKLFQSYHQDFPMLETFFATMEPTLQPLYETIDQAKATTGRPPLCHRFQLRFMVFYLLAGFKTMVEAIDYVNDSPTWQTILQMPVTRYHLSTCSRFLNRVGEETWHQLERIVIKKMLTAKLISLKTLVIDGLPLVSHISTQKTLKHFNFDVQLFREFFEQLDLSGILPAVQFRRYTIITAEVYLRLLVFQVLWGYLSISHFYRVLKQKSLIAFILAQHHRCPTYETYRSFTKQLFGHPSWPLVNKLLQDAICQTAIVQARRRDWPLNHDLHLWSGVFDNPLQLRDAGCRLNHCASKKMTYFGRGAGLIVDGASELPLFGWVQPGARISNACFASAMALASELLPSHIKPKHLVGDGEFDTDDNERACYKFLKTFLVRTVAHRAGMARRLPRPFFRLRLGVERAISRLASLPHFQRPPVLGTRRVTSYFHCGVLSLQLVAFFSHSIGQMHRCRSLKWLRQTRIS